MKVKGYEILVGDTVFLQTGAVLVQAKRFYNVENILIDTAKGTFKLHDEGTYEVTREV